MSKRSEKLFANKDNVRVPEVPCVEAPLTAEERERFTTHIRTRAELIEAKKHKESSAMVEEFRTMYDELAKKYGGREANLAVFNIAKPYIERIIT